MSHVLEQSAAGSRVSTLAVPGWAVFAGACLGEAAIAWSSSELLLTRDVFAASLSEQMAPDQVDRVLDFAIRFRWVQVAGAVPGLVLRIGMMALAIQGALLVFEGASVRFGRMFRLALLANFVKLAESALVLLWVAGADGSLRAARVAAGNPLSLGAFVDKATNLPVHDLATTVSVGQLAWCVLIAVLLRSETKRALPDLVVSCAFAWALLTTSRYAVVEVSRLVLG